MLLSKPIKTVLEIGVGMGDFHRHLNLNISNVDYIGIEGSRELAVSAQKRRETIIESMIPPLPIKSGTVSLVYMSHVIEHFDSFQTVLHVLSEFHRILEPNGLVVIAFPDYNYYKNNFYEMDYSHQYPVTRYRAETLLQDTCFEILWSGFYQGHFKGIFRLSLSPLLAAWRVIFTILYQLTGKRKFFKGQITFGRNVFIIARKLKINHT